MDSNSLHLKTCSYPHELISVIDLRLTSSHCTFIELLLNNFHHWFKIGRPRRNLHLINVTCIYCVESKSCHRISFDLFFLPALFITQPFYLNCSGYDDDEEYTAETFPWKRQTRNLFRNESFSQKANTKARNSAKFEVIDDSFSECQYSPKFNNKDIPNLTYKVIQWLRSFLFQVFLRYYICYLPFPLHVSNCAIDFNFYVINLYYNISLACSN